MRSKHPKLWTALALLALALQGVLVAHRAQEARRHAQIDRQIHRTLEEIDRACREAADGPSGPLLPSAPR